MNRLPRPLRRPAALALALFLVVLPVRADAPPPLAGTAWQLAAMDGAAVPEDAGAGIAFRADGRVGGSGGCNRFGGGYTQEGNTVTFTPLMATRMMCPNGVSDREAAFLGALAGTVTVAVDGDVLTLRAAGGSAVLAFRRAPEE